MAPRVRQRRSSANVFRDCAYILRMHRVRMKLTAAVLDAVERRDHRGAQKALAVVRAADSNAATAEALRPRLLKNARLMAAVRELEPETEFIYFLPWDVRKARP